VLVAVLGVADENTWTSVLGMKGAFEILEVHPWFESLE
jgi:hypothetical protein